MLYIIDANNLAGGLGILAEIDFHKKLIELIKKYSAKKRFILIFDGRDFMGDKYEEENITVVYTPKDSFYKNADDKILEIAEGYLTDTKEEITVITDDGEIWEKVKNLQNKLRHQTKLLDKRIHMHYASQFAKKLRITNLKNNEDELLENEKDRITQELMNIWKEK